MSCNLTSGFSLSCRDSVGGIDSVYILSGSITNYTEFSTGLLSAITGSGVFYKFELPRNVGGLTENVNASVENGTVFYEQVVDIAMHRLQSSIRNQVKVLAANPDLKIIVQTNAGEIDYTGQYFLVGRYRGLTVSAGSGTTGTAFGDLNGYSLTFTGQEPLPMWEIKTTSGSLASALNGITVS